MGPTEEAVLSEQESKDTAAAPAAVEPATAELDVATLDVVDEVAAAEAAENAHPSKADEPEGATTLAAPVVGEDSAPAASEDGGTASAPDAGSGDDSPEPPTASGATASDADAMARWVKCLLSVRRSVAWGGRQERGAPHHLHMGAACLRLLKPVVDAIDGDTTEIWELLASLDTVPARDRRRLLGRIRRAADDLLGVHAPRSPRRRRGGRANRDVRSTAPVVDPASQSSAVPMSEDAKPGERSAGRRGQWAISLKPCI